LFQGKIAMDDSRKTKKQLIDELASLRAEIRGETSRSRDKKDAPGAPPTEPVVGKRIDSLSKSLQGGVLIQDANGRITYSNQSASDIFGIPPEQIIGRDAEDPSWQLIDEAGNPIPEEKHPSRVTMRTGMPVRNAILGVFSRHPQKLHWLLINTQPIFTGNHKSPAEIVITFTDITMLKNLESSARESETRFKLLLEKTNDSLIIHELDGQIIEANTQATITYQYSREEFQRMKVEELDPDYFNWVERKAIAAAIPAYQTAVFETRHRKKNGTMIPVEVRASPINLEGRTLIMSLCRDISEHENLLKITQKSRDNFLNIIDKNPDAVVVVGNDEDIVYANPVAARLFGRPLSDMIGHPFGIPVADEDPVEIDLFSPGATRRCGEMRIVDTEWEGAPSKLVMIRDITSRKEGEQKLQEQAAETSAFLSSAKSILNDNDFLNTARHIFQSCARLSGAGAGYVALLSKDGKENELLFLESGGETCTVDPELPMPVRGLRERAYRTGKAVYNNNFMNSKWVEYLPEGHVPLDNVLFAPLNIEGKTVGIIGIANKPGDFTDEDADRATAFGDLAAIALHKSRTGAALESERRLLNFAVEQMPVPVLIAEAPKAVISKFNQGALNLLAEPVEEICEILAEEQLRYWPAFHPDGTPYQTEELPLIKAIRKGEVTRNQEMIIRNQDQERWVSMSAAPLYNDEGSIIAGIAVFPDITGFKVAEKNLVENERILRAAGQMAKIGGWEHDLSTGRIYWSKSVYDLIRIPYDQPPPGVAQHLKYYPPPDRARLREAYYRSIEEGVPFDLELQYYASEDNLRWVRVQGEPVYNNGSCIKIRGTIQDINDRIQAAEEKARLEEQFHQAQKVESIGRLAGGVAHDLNNLLSPILGYSEMIREDFSTDYHLVELIDEIHNAGIKARDLVRQLLAFSRKQTLEYHALNMNEVLSNFEKLLRRTIRENIEIRIEPFPDLPLVLADTGQIEQVIMNLAVNAQDAMPDGGTLTITTKTAEMDTEFTASHPGSKPGEYVVVSFIDTGCGMNEEVLDHLFEPFFSTKGEKGTGLGLATVYGIVKQHGGNIWVSSRKGHGSIFEVYLPVSGDCSTEAQRSEESVTSLTGTETIMLVEDDSQVRKLALSILKRRGYRVLEAENGLQALSLMDDAQGAVDLLLTDIIMPRMNGKELYDRVSAMHPEIRVLYMSGYSNDMFGSDEKTGRNYDFLQKPFSAGSLASKVRQVLDQDQAP